MNKEIHREYHSIQEKITLTNSLKHLSGKVAIYFGHTTEKYPYTDHGCIVEYLADDSYGYIVEGHGIGSNKKPEASLNGTVRRVFSDCQRFGGGDIVTVEHPPKNIL